jgi:putative spermidine/putrescine transport system ATP-binding protein
MRTERGGMAEGRDATPDAVEIVAVSKSFGAAAAVRGVTLPVRRGEFLTLLGPSGCGKTTLLNMIAGFEAPSAGSIRIDGRDVTATPPCLRDTGMVFQSYALFPHMDVFGNVAFGLQMRRLPRAEIAQAVARAIVIRPKVLLLDEPLSALDKNLRGEMQIELKELHRQTGLTTIFVTHDQGEALSLSDRIAVMSRGEIQQVSTPLELYRRPANGFVASFIGEITPLPPSRAAVEGGRLVFAFPGQLRLFARHRPDLAWALDEEVHLFVRPEHLTIVDREDGAGERIRGRVVAHIFQGAHTLTRVEASGLGLLELRVPGGAVIERAPVGSEIGIAVDLNEAAILRA